VRRALLALLALAGAAAPARAQLGGRLSLGAGGSATRLQRRTGVGETFSGITAFGAGRIGGPRFALEGAYRQGSLTPDSGAAGGLDVVEARLLATARPLPWLQVAAGPHARAWIVPGSTARWIFIEGRLRAEGFVLTEMLRTHVEVWTALSAKSNDGSSGSARGGEAGLTVRFPRSPVWARLAYAIDRAAVSGGSRVETLEDIAISVGIGRY
jgi:hypothetical protein